jgi:hypothetical protein
VALLASIAAHLDYVDLSQGWARINRHLQAVALLPSASAPRMTVPALLHLSERDAHVRWITPPPPPPMTGDLLDISSSSSSSSSLSPVQASSPLSSKRTPTCCRGFRVWPRRLEIDGGDAAENDWKLVRDRVDEHGGDKGDDVMLWRSRCVRSIVERSGDTLYSFLDLDRMLPLLERLEWRNAVACDLESLLRAAPGARRLHTLAVAPRGTNATDDYEYEPSQRSSPNGADVHQLVWRIAAALPALTNLDTTARLDGSRLALSAHATLNEIALGDYFPCLADLFRFADCARFPRLEWFTGRGFRCATADLHAAAAAVRRQLGCFAGRELDARAVAPGQRSRPVGLAATTTTATTESDAASTSSDAAAENAAATIVSRYDPDGIVTRHWVATLIREWAHPTQPCRSSLAT